MSAPTPGPRPPGKSGLSTLELLLVFLAGMALLAAHVALTVTNSDAESLVRLITILGAVAGVGAHNGRQLSQIKRQTNGELTERIRTETEAAVHRALDQRQVPPSI